MGACTIKNDFIPDSFVVKARAAIHSLRFARDMGFSCVELEGDARCLGPLSENCPSQIEY